MAIRHSNEFYDKELWTSFNHIFYSGEPQMSDKISIVQNHNQLTFDADQIDKLITDLEKLRKMIQTGANNE
jgi:hypothetical protein